jgi:hypothetical protein
MKKADDIAQAKKQGRAYQCLELHQMRYCVLTKENRWNDTPYWAMQMPVEFVLDHSTIFRPEFRRLLELFIPAPPRPGQRPRTLYRVAIPDITSRQLELSFKIEKKRKELEATWVLHKNEKQGQDALKEARDILDKLKVPVPSSAIPDNVFRLLRDKIAEDAKDPAKVTCVAEAMGIKSDQ